MTKPRRHLPIVGQGSPTADDDGPARPRWHYAVLGAAATTFAWLLSAAIVNGVLGGWTRGRDEASETETRIVVVAANVAVLLICAALGGYVVTRLTDRTNLRDAAASGALASSLGFGVAIARPMGEGGAGWALQLGVLFVLWTIGAAAGAVGGHLGRRGRTRAATSTDPVKKP